MRNNLLCKAREDRGWTQEELAERMRVSKATIKSWESGRRFPSLALRARLCEVFEMTAAQLGLEQNSTQQPSQEEAQTVTKLPEQDPNRRRMLKRVQTRWISGVLDHSLSLYQGTLIRVGLQECPSAIINPWSKVAQESNLPPRSLSPETRITDVYDEADGGLLILGEPGSGKTTLLLELARDLIARASLDEKHPIPVVFNLTSWAEKRSELPIWLVDELQVKYQVPRKLAQEWVSEDRILPLLDGLDEVAETYHAPCVQAINVYRSEHGFVSLVICSRASEYFALDTRLALNNAVTIEPLTIEQIESYVSVAGENLQRVQVALQSDPGLQEMASTPLMLNIMAQTFSATSIEDILPVQDKVSQRAMIFEKYVDIVLRHRGPANRYLSEQTIYGLSWLARQMQKHNQTEFYLERVQPDWLPDDSTRVRYRNTIIRLVFGLNHVVIAALFALFRGDSVPNKPGLFSWLGAGGKGNELLEWMRPGLAVGLAGASSLDLLMVVLASLIVLLINQGEIPTLSLKTVQVGLLHGLRNGLLVGGPVALTSGIIFALSNGMDTGWHRGIVTGLFSGLLIFLITGLVASLKSRGSHHQVRLPLRDRLVNSLLFGSCGMISFAFVYWIQAGELDLALKYGAVVGTSSMVYTFTDTMDLIRGLGTVIVPAEMMTWSWHSVWSNMGTNISKSALVTFFVLIPAVVVFSCVSTISYGLAYGVRYGLIYGLIVGMVIGITTILTQVLTSGWSSSILPKDQQIHPNEGMTRSARNSLVAALVSGPLGGGVSAIAIALAFKIIAGLAGWQILGGGFGLILGVEFALQIFLAYGGIAVIEHYMLRWYLWRDRDLPLNLVSFLDYTAKHILLRKIGGGYIFLHRLFLDYFASLEHFKRLRR